jgi:uncharacterized cupin superfamily protein
MSDPARVLVRAGERGEEQSMRHPYNPSSEIHGFTLSRLAGLARVAVNLARVPPGKESFERHVHYREEEWMYVLAGRGVVELDEREVEIGPGDFLGFPPGGPSHQVRNTGAEDLVYLAGGEVLDVDVADFPRLGRRMVGFAGRFAVYPLDAELPFLPG